MKVNDRFCLVKIVISLFVMGLMVSCSTSHVISQIRQLSKIDFDTVADLRKYSSLSYDEVRKWDMAEIENGRIVQVHLDKSTGMYTSKSIPKETIFLPSEEELSPLLNKNGDFYRGGGRVKKDKD